MDFGVQLMDKTDLWLNYNINRAFIGLNLDYSVILEVDA